MPDFHPSEYDNAVFPPAQEEETTDRKAKYRDTWGMTPLLELITEMDSTQGEKEALEEQLKEINAKYDVLRLELIPTKMEEAGLENMRVTGVGRINLTGDLYVRELDKKGFYKWLEDNNYGDLIKPTVMSSTLKAFVKACVKRGEKLPDSVKVTPFTRASITRK